jgi:TetR/AcrR family transcriptional regulator, transcriptional repressor for nem operon
LARYGQDHKASTREAIVKKASGMIRGQGLDNTGVAHVMNAVGLTHGGFYAHFAGKEALLEAAMAEAIAPSKIRLGMLVNLATEANDPGLVPERYLAAPRAADIENGCAAAALSSELHRAPMPVREAFTEGAAASAKALAELGDGDGWASYAMLVGALTLIRAVPDETLKDTIRADVVKAFRKLSLPTSAGKQGVSGVEAIERDGA